uniref:DNA repair RAD51-4-like protein n=1 Tax=Aegilops tauschii TaxID=37682 RepID=R7W0R3_AEGTA
MNEEQPHVEDRIDTLLGGGLRKGQLTEITGQSSSGKTQVCLYSAAHVAARHMGAVLYLDTSNSFSPSRIAHILDELPISLIKEITLKLLDHVISKHPISNMQPKDMRLKRVMSSIICESVFDIFALFEVLDRLEVSLNCKVTNHMVAGNGAPKPALGESWKAAPHIRLMISRDRGSNICTATTLKHTLLVASGCD